MNMDAFEVLAALIMAIVIALLGIAIRPKFNQTPR